MAEQQLYEGIKFSGDWVDNAQITQVYLWDIGPEPPVEPKKPVAPKGRDGDPQYEADKIEFSVALKKYKKALEDFEKTEVEYADWEVRFGGPIEWCGDSITAKENLERDREAVKKKRQANPRWFVSSRTRGHSHLKNRGLPEGKTPGHGQADQERRIQEGESDLVAARKSDPVFGQQELRGS